MTGSPPGRPRLPSSARVTSARLSPTPAYQILRGKGYTNYAVALAAARIIEAVLYDEHRVLPVSSLVRLSQRRRLDHEGGGQLLPRRGRLDGPSDYLGSRPSRHGAILGEHLPARAGAPARLPVAITHGTERLGRSVPSDLSKQSFRG
jgi:hypothetical protein